VVAGRYCLIEPVACGFGGVSWRCRDLDLDDEMQIKLLPEGLASINHMAARLRQEARLARRVSHPNVARVFEFGRHDGFYLLTVEYIAGESLRAWLDREGPLRPSWALPLAISLCRGLAAALAVGVVHGSIQASNIQLVAGRGAVLTGFGVVPVLEELPISGALAAGYLAQIAPERLGGAITPRSDVFAVGVLLFEALIGRLPWSMDTGDSTSEVLDRRHELQVHELSPMIPAIWAELIVDCLRFDPARRPADVATLLLRLAAPAFQP